MACLTGRRAGQPRRSSGAVSSMARDAGDAEVPAAEYDCNAAFANWVKGWSEGKKRWCCTYGYKSCPNDAAAAGAGYGAGTEHGANYNGAQVAAIKDIPYAQSAR